MTRQISHCDNNLISSPDGAVPNNRSSTEDHVVALSRDISVADHHTPDPAVNVEPLIRQEKVDTKDSFHMKNLQNNNDIHISQSSRLRPMSSRAYNPLPFKKRFISIPSKEKIARPSEFVSPFTNKTNLNVDTPIAKSVSPTPPRFFSPVPYSRHCNSYSPVNWQNPSAEVDSCVPEAIDKQFKRNVVQDFPVPKCIDEENSNEGNITPFECQEEGKPKDGRNATESKSRDEERSAPGMGGDGEFKEQKSIEPTKFEADNEQDAIESNSNGDWLIDQYSPEEAKLLIDEWRKKRSEDYQNTLKRPLTVIPEEDDMSASKTPSINVQADDMQNNTEKEDCLDIELSTKTPLRDSLEEFIQLEKHFIEEEKRRNDQLMEMIPDEESDNPGVLKCDAEVKKPSNIFAKVIKQFKAKRSPNDKESKNEAAKENDTKGSKVMEELKKTFEEHVREKDDFEKLIRKQEADLKGQLRKMDGVMDSVNNEHTNLEKVTKNFADTMKVYNNCKNEAERTRVKTLEQEFSLGILQSENSDLEKDLRELYDNIEEIQGRRSDGLQGLKQKTDEIKRSSELLQRENDEREAGTKQKIGEFNELRMTLMEKGITYVKKGTLVKRNETVRLSDVSACKSPLSEKRSKVSSVLAIDLSDINNDPPDISTPRNDTPEISSVDKLCVGKQDIDENTKPAMPIRQMSAIALVRLPGVREGLSKIPKPICHPYGSAYRDSERYTVSDKDSTKMTLSGHYNRNRFVPEGERHVIKPTLDFLNPEIELSRLKDPGHHVDSDDFTDRLDRFDNKGDNCHDVIDNYNVNVDIKRNKLSSTNNSFSNVTPNMRNSMKQVIVPPKRSIKKEIKAKIDTGLKNRPVNQKNTLVNRKGTNKTEVSVKSTVKSSATRSTKRKPSSVKEKTQVLPPLKNAKHENKMPKSPSFGNKLPLPGIQPAKQQKINKKVVLEKKQLPCRVLPPPCRVLPPIKPSNVCHGTDIENDDKSLQVAPKRQAPQAMWISFSPTQPTNGVKPTRRIRTPESNRSNKSENKRISHGRA